METYLPDLALLFLLLLLQLARMTTESPAESAKSKRIESFLFLYCIILYKSKAFAIRSNSSSRLDVLDSGDTVVSTATPRGQRR